MNYIKIRKYAFLFSTLFLLVGVVFFFINGFTLDITFSGGTQISIQTLNNDFTSAEAQNMISDVLNKNTTVQILNSYSDDSDTNSITMLQIKISANEGVLTSEETDKLVQALIDDTRFQIPDDAEVEVQNIEPSIGDEIRNRGLLAVAIAAILIVLYISIRFRAVSGFSMGLCGIIAIIHDVLAMVWVYIVFKLPVNESFIASILTIIGYSINNSIVVFDRIRENRKNDGKSTTPEIVNKSIKQTLLRSILASATTLCAAVIVYVLSVIYGITSVQQFSFPLIIGLIFGTYSSIFISGPLWSLFKERKEHK